MELSGSQLIEFRDLLVSAFSEFAMDELLTKHFNKERLANIAGSALGKYDAYLRLVEWALDRGWIFRLIEAAKTERPARQDVQGFFAQVDFSPYEPKVTTRLQQLVDERLGVHDAATWLLRFGKRMGQVCRIDAPGTGGGTGFLVGPDLVLTNYHVLKYVIPTKEGGSGTNQLDQVRFEFDDRLLGQGPGQAKSTVRRLAGAGSWLVSCSPPRDDEAPLATPPGKPGPRLDYALVRLDAPADVANRGFVELPTDPKAAPPAPDDPLLILQHPQGGALKLAIDTRSVIALTHNGERVRYRTNTDNGSSGSPCFDLDWNLVALHNAHGADSGQPNDPLYNAGIPITRIAAVIAPHLASPGPPPKPRRAPKAAPKGKKPPRKGRGAG